MTVEIKTNEVNGIRSYKAVMKVNNMKSTVEKNSMSELWDVINKHKESIKAKNVKVI